jgi:hypothetical protein
VPDSTFRTGGNRRCGNIFRADPFETHVYDAEDVSFTQDYAEPLVEETSPKGPHGTQPPRPCAGEPPELAGSVICEQAPPPQAASRAAGAGFGNLLRAYNAYVTVLD